MFYHKSYPRAGGGGVQKMISSAGICLNSCMPARPADTSAAPKTQARVRQFLIKHFLLLLVLSIFVTCTGQKAHKNVKFCAFLALPVKTQGERAKSPNTCALCRLAPRRAFSNQDSADEVVDRKGLDLVSYPANVTQ
ncbi:hypothetical protein Hanom_Chr00s002804g01704871 [Helianthus anomalus]